MGWLNLFYVCVFCILQCLSLHLFLTNTCWSLSCKVWQRTSRESRWRRRSWFQGKVRKSLRNWRWSPARSFLGISQILKNENTNFSKGFYVLSSEENYQRQLGFQSRDWQQRCPFRRHCIEGSPLNFKLKGSLHCIKGSPLNAHCRFYSLSNKKYLCKRWQELIVVQFLCGILEPPRPWKAIGVLHICSIPISWVHRRLPLHLWCSPCYLLRWEKGGSNSSLPPNHKSSTATQLHIKSPGRKQSDYRTDSGSSFLSHKPWTNIKGEVRRFFFICSKFLLAQN